MTQEILISVIGLKSVGAVCFDKALSDEDAVEFEQLLMQEKRLDPILEFLKAKWPESEIKVKRTYGTVIVGGRMNKEFQDKYNNTILDIIEAVAEFPRLLLLDGSTPEKLVAARRLAVRTGGDLGALLVAIDGLMIIRREE